jgi:hypothetical protein
MLGKNSIISFGQSKNGFLGEKTTGNQYGFIMDNQSDVSLTVAVCTGDFKSLSALQAKFPGVDALLAEGTIKTVAADVGAGIVGGDLVATAMNSSNGLDRFVALSKRSPFKVVEINMECSNSDVFNTVIESKEDSLFQEKGNQLIHLSNSIQSTDFHKDRKRLDLWARKQELFFGPDNVIIFTVPANSKIIYNFKIGAILSASQFLKNASDAGRAYIETKYNVAK